MPVKISCSDLKTGFKQNHETPKKIGGLGYKIARATAEAVAVAVGAAAGCRAIFLLPCHLLRYSTYLEQGLRGSLTS